MFARDDDEDEDGGRDQMLTFRKQMLELKKIVLKVVNKHLTDYPLVEH